MHECILYLNLLYARLIFQLPVCAAVFCGSPTVTVYRAVSCGFQPDQTIPDGFFSGYKNLFRSTVVLQTPSVNLVHSLQRIEK